VLGRGLAGRMEVAFEVDPDHRGRGLGRAIATAARHLAPRGEPMFAQVSPGNVASVRALLGAGYVPVGAEVLYARRHRG
jgi:RimJ/RimL family protein N-acetyltransferase